MSLSEAPPAIPNLPSWAPPQGHWTYKDYCRLPDDGKRYEVIRGVLYMSPTPRVRHQRAIFRLAKALDRYTEARGLGEVFLSPLDVRIPGLESTVQPDVIFLARENGPLAQEKYIYGPPDLCVEVLSPSNLRHDRKTKFELYAEAGVAEYWIVDPVKKSIEVFTLEGSAYALHGRFAEAAMASSKLLAGYEVSVASICG